jgi:hypothetical protein
MVDGSKAASWSAEVKLKRRATALVWRKRAPQEVIICGVLPGEFTDALHSPLSSCVSLPDKNFPKSNPTDPIMRAFLSLLLVSCFSTAVAQESAPVPVRERERRVYVPFDELEKVFKDGGKGVFLPYREFLDLWNELTIKREEDDKPPPAEAVIAKAEYTGSVEGDSVVLDAKITAESFKKGWVLLPLTDKGRSRHRRSGPPARRCCVRVRMAVISCCRKKASMRSR